MVNSQYDETFEYLAKTFSKTNKKDTENYIINRIWHKLSRTDIKPETQKFVRFDNGGRAFIDLFFPSLLIGVEIDEPYHQNQKHADITRSEKIIAEFQKINSEDLLIYRIDASLPIADIDEQIYQVLKAMRNRIVKWPKEQVLWYDQTEDMLIDYLKSQHVISVSDNIRFKTIVKACELFDVYYERQTFTLFSLKSNPDYLMWFIDAENNPNALIHHNKNIEQRVTGVNYKQPRITFLKTKNPVTHQYEYLFIGIYEFEEENANTHVYKQTKTHFNLSDITPQNR